LPLEIGRPSLLEKRGVSILTYRDPGYPRRLLEIYDYPPLLYVRGQLTETDDLAVAVVGSRQVGSYGRRMAERIAFGLAQRGVTVVSGLARGIDSQAHRGALEGGGRTLAVLGSGIDVIYPPENRALAEQIARSGAVVSEFPLGTKPEAGHFPRRNRIISGLSRGVVVAAAGIRSGALLTANFALDQGREVFAVPGNIDCPGSQGPHHLIQVGAKLVQDVDDILEELQVPGRPLPRGAPSESAHDLSTEEKRLLDLLTDRPAPVDHLISRSGFQPSETLALLFSLEMKGFIQQLSGKRFVRK
jgi:DNA processing protein